MRSIEELLSHLQHLDIHVWVEGEKLRYNAPQGALTPELRVQLKEHKTEILSFLREESGVSQTRLPSIPPASRDEIIPLSFSQQRLWFFDQLEGHSVAYNIPFALQFQGKLRIDTLEQCFTEIIRRHEILRTIFPTINGTPVQVVTPPQPVSFDVKELPLTSEKTQETEITRITLEDAQKPFDLEQGPLLRLSLFRINEQNHILLLTIHHIIYDAWSASVLVHEFVTLYNAFFQQKPSPLLPLSIQYADFAVWQRQWMGGEIMQKQLTYWKEQLANAPTLLDLPTDKPRPPKQSLEGDVVLFELDDTLTQQLRTLSRQAETTLFMTLLTGFALLMFRYSNQEDIVIGSPIANRNRQELEPLIGFFVNTLALRINASGNPTFTDLLQQVRQVSLDAYSHQDVPFEQLVETLHPQRNLSHAPLCQVMFVLQNVPIEELNLPEVSLFPKVIDTGSTEFDLILEMRQIQEKLQGKIIYNCDLFYKESIQRFTQHFHCLLQSIITNPQQRISDLSILTQTERQQILVEWNDTGTEFPAETCIHHLFEVQVEKNPEAIAVIFEDLQLSYHELNQRANQLAHYLRKRGIGPEVLIGICVERSLEMIIGILGILKAGGAYLPLDPAYPQERLAFMMSDSQIPILLTQEHLRTQLPEFHGYVMTLDTDWPLIAQEPETQPQSPVLPENLAYVIYTSGSTGKPKGTLLAHRGLCNVSQAQINHFHITPGDNVLQFSSFSFDAATFEIMMALTTGATICLADRETLLPGPDLIKFLQEQKISIVTLPPSALANLPVEELPVLRKITVAGEACPPDLVARWAQGRSFFNLYGPTETTIWATAAQCTESTQKPPIGYPIDNTQVYILDDRFEPVSIGIPGELYIGGVGLARGYLNRPGLTAEKFIPNPFTQEFGARLYKTGDLACYLPDGNIEFLGRIDHQVKLRGFRIELGEIEAILSIHPTVRETAVIIREDRPGQKRLVTYIVPENDQPLVVNDLRQFLSEKLPDYMVPSAYVMLDALPLTPNGKIDRRALPAPETASHTFEDTYIASRTPLETLLANIWAESLQVKRIGIHDDFFERGGHSLQATQVITKISVALEREVPVKYLFLYPTVAALAEQLEQEMLEDRKPALPEEVAVSSEPIDWDAHYVSSSFQIERRSLTALLTAGEIAPVDAAALSYAPQSFLRQSGLSRDQFFQTFFEDLPLLTSIIETHWGRIGLLALPRLSSELYTDQEDCIQIVLDALKMAENIGAQVVSLTGIIPSATDYGYAITRAIGKQETFPRITTGHATTTAAVVLAIKAILEHSDRDLVQERVGFIGLGSVGMSSLALMLQGLLHPQEILLCDVYSKREHLEKIQETIVNNYDFQGKTRIVTSQAELPVEIYDATFIVGATNVPDILDIQRLQAGTLIVDDSGPHCFSTQEAISRFEKQQDILFTEGGILKSPFPIHELRYLPRWIENVTTPEHIHAFLQHKPSLITGCILSSLLSAHFDHLKPTVGIVPAQESLQHYDMLTRLGFQSAPLHCEDYTLPEALIQQFRGHHFRGAL